MFSVNKCYVLYVNSALFISMKICNICKIQKPLEEYYKHKKTKDGRQSKCKNCEKLIRQNTRQNTPGHYYKLNPDYYKEYYKKWRKENKTAVQQIQKRHYHKKLKYDPVYQLRASVGSRIRQCLKTRNQKKLGSAANYLGCSYEFLKSHLEMQFKEGMTWDNYGKWEIDHIYPLSKGGSFHYSNLQPLWEQDNLIKSDTLLED